MLAPQPAISSTERSSGVRNLLVDAGAATAIGALNSGAVLLALALHIGASTVEIGLLAAIPLLTQILQAPTVTLVERLRRRKAISVAALAGARVALPVYAIVPFIADRQLATMVLLLAALTHYSLNAVAACSWNSWIRDFIPGKELGRFSSRRTAVGTLVSAAATLAAAFLLHRAEGSQQLGDVIFAGLYLFGTLCGVLSIVALARVPEPMMLGSTSTVPLHKLLIRPLKDRNFRNLLRYLASWQFAVNLATPFFTVYFVRELGFGMAFVLMLTLASQLANVAVVRTWGQLSDRFANKSVLATATPVFLLCIAGMAFASEFTSAESRGAYLILLHLVMGAAGAGVGLASGNMVMRLSPEGTATSYMATNALISALAAGVAPVIGGWAADFFARRRLELHIQWTSPAGVEELLGLAFTSWEFFFLIAALFGLYTLHRLSVIEEPGTVAPREIVQHVWSSARRTLRNASSVAGLRLAISFPGGDLIKAREHRGPVTAPLVRQAAGGTGPGQNQRIVGALLQSAYEPTVEDHGFESLIISLDKLS